MFTQRNDRPMTKGTLIIPLLVVMALAAAALLFGKIPQDDPNPGLAGLASVSVGPLGQLPSLQKEIIVARDQIRAIEDRGIGCRNRI